MSEFKCPKCGAVLTVNVKTAQRDSSDTKYIDDVKMMFPEDLENLLSFEDQEDRIIIKPRQFLGSDNFAKIAAIIRGVGGEYVSAGKGSHFRIGKKKD